MAHNMMIQHGTVQIMRMTMLLLTSATLLQKFVKIEAGQLSISCDLVPASITHMGLFDRLYDHGVARKDGAIVKCMEDYISGYQVCKLQHPKA